MVWQSSFCSFPSKSLVIWRLMHKKLARDENLMLRGCNLPSICNLCMCSSESSFHLFFACPYAVQVWNWLAQFIGFPAHFTYLEDVCKLCDRNWTPQCKVVILAF
jgi:hypothetical protein